MGFLNILSIRILAGSFLMLLLHRSETGEYLALDLGGTNFRVLLITMKEGRMVDEVKRATARIHTRRWVWVLTCENEEAKYGSKIGTLCSPAHHLIFLRSFLTMKWQRN